MKPLFAALVVVSVTRVAHAGICLGEDEFEDAVAVLEKRVTNPKVDMGYASVCMPGAVTGEYATKKRIARVNAACTKILTRDPADQQCVMLAGYQKKSELGGVKVFDAIAAWNSGPWNGPRLIGTWDSDFASIDLDLFLTLGDTRAAALVVERWTTFQPQADAKEKSKKRTKSDMPAWSRWRQQAAAVLGAVGTSSDVAFLEKQASATKDTAVKRACKAAISTIKKRDAAARPKP